MRAGAGAMPEPIGMRENCPKTSLATRGLQETGGHVRARAPVIGLLCTLFELRRVEKIKITIRSRAKASKIERISE